VFENRVLWKIPKSKSDGVKREKRKLHKEMLHNLYSPLSTVRDRPSKGKTGRACSTYGKKRKGAYRVWVGKPEKRGHLEDLGIDVRTVKWI
jgi:hypothetical protein